MTIKYHDDVVQGSDEWLQMRCGVLTASEVKLILTPTLKVADNDKTRGHVWELAAQRLTRFVEPHYVGDDMLRGFADEIEARRLYSLRFAKVAECGFITNDKWGFTIGYSPDGLVGDNGLIECKSRRQKYQVQTVVEFYESGAIPAEYVMQCQTGLLVSEREWIDLISYSGGLPMIAMRVYPDEKIQASIIEAADAFETKIRSRIKDYCAALESEPRLVPTERRVETEMYV